MTATRKNTNLMTDDQLDEASGGVLVNNENIPALKMHQGAMNSFSLNYEEIKWTLQGTRLNPGELSMRTADSIQWGVGRG